jgi:hypothetical protein
MSKVSLLFFGNHSNKTVIRSAYMWELLIANHLEQSEILSQSQVELEVHNCVGVFYEPLQGAESCRRKTNFLS